MFRKIVSFFAAAALVLVVTPSVSAATVAGGASCTTKNAISIVGYKKFVCIKVGNKLVWDKGTFNALMPIGIPILADASANPITFANVTDRVSDIPKAAFDKSQAVLASNADRALTIDINVGPHTKLDFPGGVNQIRDAILKTAKFWNGFSIVKYISVYAYNGTDEAWAEAKWMATATARKYAEKTGFASAIRGNCQSSSAPGKFSGKVGACSGSAAGVVSNTQDAAMSLGMTGTSTDIYFLTGALIGHEFTHTVQNANWFNAPKCNSQTNCFSDSNEFDPCWINEGQPNIIGRLVVSNTLDEYIKARAGLPYGWGPTTYTDYSQASLKKYLYEQSPKTCYQDGAFYKLGYSIGALTTEVLTAIGGPQSTMALLSLGADGYDFASAFKKVYGISWDQASTIISKVLAIEYAAAGPAPKF